MLILNFSVVLLLISIGALASDNPVEYTLQLTGDEFSSFIKERGVRAVFVYGSDKQLLSRKGQRALKQFFDEYEKSAEALHAYGAKLALVDCDKLESTTTVLNQHCQKANIQKTVNIFRNGASVLDLDQENMFDVDSIVSNVLQVVLLRQVAILQTRKERREAEMERDITHNFVFSFQQAIGTHAHRIFMEVAHASIGMVDFAITTEKRVVSDLPNYDVADNSAIWLLGCQGTQQPCEVSKYMGNMDLGSLSRWVRALTLPLVLDVTGDGEFNPYADHDLDIVTIFYDQQSGADVREEADVLATKLRGLLGIIMVNVEEKDATEYGFKTEERIPALAVQTRGSNELKFMPHNQVPLRFVMNELSAHIKGLKSKLRDDLHALDQEDEGFVEPEDYSDDELEFDRYEESVETQDDQVADAVSRMSAQPLDRQHVPELTDVTFPEQIRAPDLQVVLFYLTFNARSMAFMRSYIEASQVLAAESLTPLSAIDCYDWTDICGKNNITIYPSVRIYRKDRQPVDYRGMLGAAAIVSTIKLYLADTPAVLTSREQADQFMDGQLPANIDGATRTSVLGLFDLEQKEDIARFKEAAEQLEGKFLFGLATGDLAKQLASQYQTKPPSLVVYKRHDKYEPYVSNRQLTSSSDIVQYIISAALPVFPELTATSFPVYFAMKKPFVLLFHSEADSPLHQQLGALAKDAAHPGLILAWMDVHDPGSAAAKVLEEYDSQAELPVLALVNHDKGTIHIKPTVKTSETVGDWMQAVLDGKIAATSHLKDGQWKPRNPGYNFLKFMDQDARMGAMSQSDPDLHDDTADHMERLRNLGWRARNPGYNYLKFIDEDLKKKMIEKGEKEPAAGGSTEAEEEGREELQNLRQSRLFHHNTIKARQQKEASEKQATHQHTEL